MYTIPSPVLPSIELRPITLRKFATPYHQSRCRNCLWVSYDYPTKDDAENAGDLHADRCCNRINAELALQVPVTPVLAQDLARDSIILLKDLRTLEVENVEVFDDDVMLTYRLNGTTDVMTLPLGHIVKVVT